MAGIWVNHVHPSYQYTVPIPQYCRFRKRSEISTYAARAPHGGLWELAHLAPIGDLAAGGIPLLVGKLLTELALI